MITFSLRKLFIISYLTPINNWHSCIIIIHKRHETFSRKRATKKNAKQGKGEKQIAIIYTNWVDTIHLFLLFFRCVLPNTFLYACFSKSFFFSFFWLVFVVFFCCCCLVTSYTVYILLCSNITSFMIIIYVHGRVLLKSSFIQNSEKNFV